MKPIFLLTFFVLTYSFLSCSNEEPIKNDCECPLEKQKSKIRSTSNEKDKTTQGGNGVLTIDVPYIKKVLDARLELSGEIKTINEVSEEVYWEIINDNPHLTQDANAFQETTCALYLIVCEDNSISERERRQEMRALIEKYEERLEHILSVSDKPKPINDDKPDPPKPTTPKSTPVNTAPVKKDVSYLTSQTPVDIATITIGDKSFLDLGSVMGNWMDGQGYSVNGYLFTPQFMTDFGNRMHSGDIRVFKESGAVSLVNCVCLFDQQVKMEESEMAGEAFITAILAGKLTVFNLKTNIPYTEPLNLRGAGITTTRAMESLEDKLKAKYTSIYEKLKTCK